jgi:hypothetical protein
MIVLRLKAQDKATVLAHVRRTIAVLQQRSPFGELWIVQSDRALLRTGN